MERSGALSNYKKKREFRLENISEDGRGVVTKSSVVNCKSTGSIKLSNAFEKSLDKSFDRSNFELSTSTKST